MLKKIMLACCLAPMALASDLLPMEQNTIAVFKKIAPLVVHVHKLKTFVSSDLGFRDVRAGTGSGFLWNGDGYVVTNYHVIAGANKIAVTLLKGQTVHARMIGGIARKDIAVLKIENKSALKDIPKFKQLDLGDSNQLQVGQQAIAIGNPFGLDRTLTSGVVSALGREIPGFAGRIHNMIQTDASVNPGNSGGPLLNSQGELIGMNTLIFTRSGTSAGINFAVPANDIKRIVNQIINYGRIKQAGIGIQVFSNQVSDYLDIKGVIIKDVMPRSPAEKAGLKGTVWQDNGEIRLGDVIIAINDHPVKHYDDLFEVIDTVKVGDTITVTLKRGQKTFSVKIKTIELAE